MRNLLLYLQNPRYLLESKAFGSYIAAVLMFILVTSVSFSVRNYVTDRLSFDIYSEKFLESMEDPESVAEVRVKKGDTLKKVLLEQRLSKNEVASIIKTLKKSNIDVTLKPGQVIQFDYAMSDIDDDSEDDSNILNAYSLKKINIELSNIRSVQITNDNGAYSARDIQAKLIKKYVAHKVQIKNSLATSLLKVGISTSNIQEIIGAYSYQVDFQRQIKNGDTIEVIVEKFYSENDDFIHNGKVIFSSLNLSENNYNIYLYKDHQSGQTQYYSESGKSVKRSLLRTPINVARISSKFGKRQHPVNGFTQMHKGVDFSAPSGTPILAAGDGVIKEMGYMGAYGNIVKIRHSPSLTTAYAHASKFAPNVKVGSKVKQGQVIAYVGRTGRATGPHCHFEVIINGKHVNPMSVQTTPGLELKSKTLADFEKYKKQIKQFASSIEHGKPTILASLEER
ncbi:MAG: M23 family metallopeptidase [Rickettsiaceae bacterium]|nr:M23 family metallopeptidase [Rickettsiaceae bacterium]